jgi:hypothetical protein
MGDGQSGTINQIYEVGSSISPSSRSPKSMQVSAPRYVHLISQHLVLTVFLGSFMPNLPVSSFWLDYFAVNRTCPVDSMPRQFGLMPARFTYRLDYLIRKPWYERFWTSISGAVKTLVARLLESLRSIRLMR